MTTYDNARCICRYLREMTVDLFLWKIWRFTLVEVGCGERWPY